LFPPEVAVNLVELNQHTMTGIVLVANAGELPDGLFAETSGDVAGLEAHP